MTENKTNTPKSAETKSTLSKALTINLNSFKYGAFAEIGAGQEVARFFFQAGRASQTIAKTISAYDMIYSDEIYGKEKSGRYVCESRLVKMLDKEFGLLERRLKAVRGDKTHFFAFANTVTTGSESQRYCHGWMGVRFQTEPNGPANDIIMHVRMLDKHRLQQQETLGVLGVNLIYAASFHTKNRTDFLNSLTENIKDGQISVDMIKIQGPAVSHFDQRLLNLELVKRNLVEAVLFNAKGEVVNAADEIYNKAIFVQRGTFKPVTNTHLDIFEKGFSQFKSENKLKNDECLKLFEITMNQLLVEGKIDEQDFLNRVDTLSSIGQSVLISNFSLFYQLKKFFLRFSQKPVSLIIGANILSRLFEEKHYASLDGGLVEGLSKLFTQNTKLYVYPYKTTKSCTTAKTFHPEKSFQKIYEHYFERQQIQDITGCDQADEYLHSDDIRKMIQKKENRWEKSVPAAVAQMIKSKKLFGYK